jgi:hypothetical protein
LGAPVPNRAVSQENLDHDQPKPDNKREKEHPSNQRHGSTSFGMRAAVVWVRIYQGLYQNGVKPED